MKTKTIKLDITQAIITHADLLAERHASYVSEFVTRANSELYVILAEILKLHEQVEASKQRDKLIKQMRRLLKDNYNIKTQTNTKTTALVVKYVTRASRKTAHVYGKVLDIAIADGITSDDLVDYIKCKGGIDKVRKAVASAETAQQHKAEETALQKALHSYLNQCHTPIATVQLVDMQARFPCAKDVAFHQLLCHFNTKTLQYEVVAAMYPSSAMEMLSMREYLEMLEVATYSDSNEFYDKCAQHGLNMDILLRWMRANDIADAESARAIAKSLITGTSHTRTPTTLKLAA